MSRVILFALVSNSLMSSLAWDFCESFGNAEAPILEEDRFCCRGGSQTDPQRLSDPGGFVARP